MFDEPTIMPNDNAAAFPWPIAVMSFERPTLLRSVLLSLKEQSIPVKDDNICLFQDANIDPSTGANSATQGCLDVFSEFFPKGKIYPSVTNLGVALNFDRAEKLFFEDRKVEAGLFLEDDLLLSPNYLLAMQSLLRFALDAPQIAYVAAYGDHHASLSTQMANRRKIVSMHHKWGFGLTSRQWERQAPLIEPYLDIVRRRPYARRDHDAIRNYFRSLGYSCSATSQDAAKDVASAVLGTVKVMSFVCFGKYIGRHGLHQREEDYLNEGYESTALFPDAVTEFDLPDSKQIASLMEKQRPPTLDKRQFTSSRETKGAFEGAVILTERKETEDGAEDRPKSIPSDINIRMTEPEVELLRRYLRRSRYYLEFGCGGSTVLAIKESKGSIVSVDSDAIWINQLQERDDVRRALTAKRLAFYHADIGPVGDWGTPKDESRIKSWKNYYMAPWEFRDYDYDLVLIDGRFRMMCALATATCMGRGTMVALHDYGNRRGYFNVERYFDIVERADQLVVMQRRPNINYKALIFDFVDHLYNAT